MGTGPEIDDRGGTNLLAKAKTPLPEVNFQRIAAAGYTDLLIMNTKITQKFMTGIWNNDSGRYEEYNKTTTKPYWLAVQESPAATEQLQQMLSKSSTHSPAYSP